jgi:hypothetical protein
LKGAGGGERPLRAGQVAATGKELKGVELLPLCFQLYYGSNWERIESPPSRKYCEVTYPLPRAATGKELKVNRENDVVSPLGGRGHRSNWERIER